MKKGQKYPDKLIVLLKSIALEKDSIVNSDEIRYKLTNTIITSYIWVLVNKSENISRFFFENGPLSCDVLTHFLGDAELEA